MEETNGKASGWDALWAIGGAAIGYWAGMSRNNYNNGVVPGAVYTNGIATVNSVDNTHCRTCFEQGVESGQNTCGLNFIAQQVAANAAAIQGVNANINAMNVANLQQKIADQSADIASLKTQQIVSNVGCQTNTQLSGIAQTLNSLVTGCAVRSVPACPTSCNC